jgi:tetratricopeptide (TPR) repeat protein
MRSPAEEPALLTALADLLRERTLIVTFNGRGFDLPLLRARYLYNRRYLPNDARDVPLLAEGAPHLDLLQPARRLWKRRLQSCRLIHLEEHILGATRTEEDVPGWLIPQLYVAYVRSGNAREMQRVFYHNGEDILSTTALAAQAIALVAEPHAADRPPTAPRLHGLDWFSLGRSYEQAGRLDEAEAAYRRALEELHGSDLREVFGSLCGLLKRSRRWADAVAAWERWLTSVPGADATPYIELAKYYEWEAHDLEQAEMWAAFGLHTLRTAPAYQRLPGQADELEHRLERIRRKRERPLGDSAGTLPTP